MHIMKPSTPFESKITLIFAGVVLVLLVLAYTALQLTRHAQTLEKQVEHAQEVLDTLNAINVHTLHIDVKRQNFIITGDQTLLPHLDVHRVHRGQALQRLRELTQGNAAQQEVWHQIRELLDQRRAMSERIIALRLSAGELAARRYSDDSPMLQTRVRLAELLDAMEAHEQRLLRTHQTRHDRAQAINAYAYALLALLIAALLLTTFWFIRRQLRANEAGRRALAASEQTLATTLNSIGDAVMATDSQGRVSLMNPVAERLSGWSFAAAQGQPLATVLHLIDEHSRAAVDLPVAQVLSSGSSVGLSNHRLLLGRDGHEWPITTTAAPIRGAEQQTSGVVLVLRDVGLERAAARALRSQNELLEQRVRERTAQLQQEQQRQQAENHVLDAISSNQPLSAVLETIAHEVEGLMPDALCSILLLDPDGVHLRHGAAPNLSAEFVRAVDGLQIGPQAGSCGTAVHRNQQVIVSDIGTDPLWADYAALALPLGLRACWSTPVRGGSAQVLGAFAVYYRSPRTPTAPELECIDDWTRLTGLAIERQRDADALEALHQGLERRVAERTAELELARLEAQRLSQVKDIFLATMSHEIRTPLNALLGMLELLGLRALDHEAQRMLGVALQSGQALLHIIDDILDFSKIEAGKLEIHPEPTSIRELIELSADSFRNLASSKGVRLLHWVDPQLSPLLLADRLRLRQILNNLLSNAVKFTHAGQVTLKAERVQHQGATERVRLSVADTGIGIAPAVQATLFQPFSQGDAQTTRRYGGSGLGLAICRRLADLMHAELELQSTPGLGTTLSLTLDLPVLSAGELQASPAAVWQPKRGSQSIPSAFTPADRAQERTAGRLVLLVDDHPSNRDLLSAQLQVLGYASDQASEGHEALSLWECERYGLLITDCHMPDMDGYQLMREIRRREAATGRARLPILACTANALYDASAECAAAGADDILVKPSNLLLLQQKLEQLLPRAAPQADGAAAPADSATTPAAEPAAAAPADATPTATAADGPAAPPAQPPMQPPTQAPALRRGALRELSGGDLALERTLLLRFGAAHQADAEALWRAAAARDAATLAHLAHRTRGAALMIGADPLGSASLALERAAKEQDWNAIETALAAWKEAAAQLEPELPT
jgi:PAS domain S-box-containing protein